MQKWEDIYNLSCDVLHSLCHSEEPDECSLDEIPKNLLTKKVTDRLIDSNYLENKRKEQDRFDARVAFGKLKRRNRRRMIFRIGSVAAMVAIIFGSIILLYNTGNSDRPVQLLQQEILPGSRQAVLRLSDGRNVNLSNVQNLKIETGAGVINVDSTGASCGLLTVPQEAVMDWNTLFIPRGGEYKLILADGTAVWINSDSELRFPTQFKGENRMVYLKGEAYFEVKPDATHPFIVNTGLGNIQVLGTQFNVNVYNPDFIVATLVEGKISYHQVPVCRNAELNPGEQLTYRRTEGYHRICKVNTKLYTSWKNNLFCFEEQRLEQIMETLSRWYDIQVFFKSTDLKELEFSGTLDKYSNVEPLLRLFELGSKVKFDINGKAISIDWKQ